MSTQLDFLPSLDFPGRTTLMVSEIAERLGYSPKHVVALIADGSIPALNGKSSAAVRPSFRVPIEAYCDFVVTRVNGGLRAQFISSLPAATRRTLIMELQASLKTNHA